MKDNLLGSKKRDLKKDKYALNLVDKILSCHGNVDAKSAARMVDCSHNYVCFVWRYHGLEQERLGYHRSFAGYNNKKN